MSLLILIFVVIPVALFVVGLALNLFAAVVTIIVALLMGLANAVRRVVA